ncbi:MAG: hypothetical protein A2020_11300 [Lentisphaerae bacterium GWF2_45_14]|nr:MAG: hypothetical protein A2020_11300 [Lentisphaerae bacterium GWF2_45_14]
MKRELAFYFNPNNPQRKLVLLAFAEEGIKYVGIDGTGWDPDTQIGEIKQLNEDLENFGLKMLSMHSCFPITADGKNEAPHELYEEQIRELRRFGLFGGKTAVYHACFMRDIAPENIDARISELGWENFLDSNVKTLQKLSDEAAKYGINLVLENLWHSVHSESVEGFIPIVKAADRSNIGICLDSGHAHLAGKNVADEIRKAGKLLKDTHFHDNIGKVNGIFLDQHLPPGLGTINWQNACEALDEIDYSHPLCFEGILGNGDDLEKGRFKGMMTYNQILRLASTNWRAFEFLTEDKEKVAGRKG